MKKDKELFSLVTKAVEKVSGYRHKVNVHVVVSLMNLLTDLTTYSELIIITPADGEHHMKVPKDFSFYDKKHMKLLKGIIKKLAEFYVADMYCKTGAKTDKKKF